MAKCLPLRTLFAVLAAVLLTAGLGHAAASTARAQASPAEDVTYFGPPDFSISSAVKIPEGRSLYWSSGTVPPAIDTTRARDDVRRYGDTETQATGLFERIEEQLAEEDLDLSDVVYLRVYIAPGEDETHDFQGFFDAYAKFFGTDENPVKPARSTVGVGQLVNPAWRLEVEAFAAYPSPEE